MKTWFADESDIEEESNLVAMPQKIIEVIKKDELIKTIDARIDEITKNYKELHKIMVKVFMKDMTKTQKKKFKKDKIPYAKQCMKNLIKKDTEELKKLKELIK